MKNIIPVILLVTVFVSCSTVHKLTENSHKYSENISFTIEKVEETKSIGTGNGSRNANRGNKFIIIHSTFKNNSNRKLPLDFNNFALINPSSQTKHQVEWTMLVGSNWSNYLGPANFGKIKSYIRKRDTKKRKLVFIYPENDKAKTILVNDKVVELNYSE